MDRILLVEDSKSFATFVKKKIEAELDFEVEWVSNYSDAVKLFDDGKSEFFIGVLDLTLPDAPEGEIVDLALSKNIPPIVFTGDFSDDVRDTVWSKKVVDYILKEGPHNIDYLISLIGHIHRNRAIKVLVVDDSRVARGHICELLKTHQYEVFESASGKEAISVLDENPDIKMAIIDYYMPDVGGYQLTKEIRTRYRKEELAIIGMSAQGSNNLSAHFIKNGANDFIVKPFLAEEFYCRITQNVEMIEHVRMLKDLSSKDYLTGLYNRRFFFELGEKLYANKKRSQTTVIAAMIDIDHFKAINDTYGHDAGDEALKHVALMLKGRFRESDIVSRFGGEEFCILAADMDREGVTGIFEGLRGDIEKSEINIGGGKINLTVSVGVCIKPMESLDEMIKQADLMLYDAKEGGRNRVELFS